MARRDLRVWSEGHLDIIDEIYAEDAVFHDAFGEAHSRESWKESVQMIRTAFPDFHAREDQTISEGDTVFSRYTLSGTFEGEYRGFEPTGKSFEVHGLISYRVNDDRIVEVWNATNAMAMSQQLGLLG